MVLRRSFQRHIPALWRLAADRSGNVALIAAAAFPLLIGAAGLAVDGVHWVLQKREVQAATDAAAMAGVYGLIADGDMQNAVNSSLTKGGGVPDNASIQAIESPPGHEADPFAVTVRVTIPAKTTFASMFMKTVPTITAEATASVVENGKYCSFALGDMDDDAGVVVRPNSKVDMECGVTTNATGAKAIQADSSSSLKAADIRAYGGIDMTSISGSRTRAHALAQEDPLANSDPPQVPNTGCPQITANPDAANLTGGKLVLEPGCYATMYLNGPVFLQDGEYILNKGNFVVGPQGHVECSACTIFLTSETAGTDGASIGKVKISSDATVKMHATREGPNQGILFYQDRHAARDLPGDENHIGGGSFTELEGLIYFPSETVYVDGNMSPNLQCTRFIARRLIFAGTVYVSKSCDGLDKVTFMATEVRLLS
ncbi:pilus assembly protein [Sphingomonas limnosediminicola]|uniref:Pilus assembly protein n=1 Tax=Sphingomonas limnosediminicola TaxID=940133 RepID=A0ABP7L1T6_9SPHN